MKKNSFRKAEDETQEQFGKKSSDTISPWEIHEKDTTERSSISPIKKIKKKEKKTKQTQDKKKNQKNRRQYNLVRSSILTKMNKCETMKKQGRWRDKETECTQNIQHYIEVFRASESEYH